MTSILLYTILSLSLLGALLAIVLYAVAQRFKVYEDPNIDLVAAVLPGANCGGCGQAGCHDFAKKCTTSEDLSTCFCPVGGNTVMQQVANVLGRQAIEQAPMIAVVRCAGSCAVRPQLNTYDGSPACAVAAQLYGGPTGCSYGCLGLGDCVRACMFGALHIDAQTGLATVDPDKCTACGACVKACPKGVIELRPRGPKDRRLYVACLNKEKGAIARKACSAACIGCRKCVNVCPFEAISVTDNLAYIDPAKCRLCRKCVAVCPENGIVEVNFPPKVNVPSQSDTLHE